MEVKKTPKADLENKKSIFLEIGLCVSLLLAIFMFGMSSTEKSVADLDIQQEIIEMEMIEITREEQRPPEAPRQQQVQVTTDIINIVRDDKKIDASLTFADFDQDADFVFEPAAGGTSEEVIATDEPFLIVEDMPQFQGGDNSAFRAWVQKNVVYPAIALENGIQGRVVLQFVVERDGSVADVQIMSSPDRSLSEAATKTVMSSPKWTPGKQRGVPVRVRYTLPVDFKMQ